MLIVGQLSQVCQVGVISTESYLEKNASWWKVYLYMLHEVIDCDVFSHPLNMQCLILYLPHLSVHF